MNQTFRLFVLLMLGWNFAQAQITLPYNENLEAEATGGTGCGAAQVFSAINWTNETSDDIDWVIDVSGTGSGSTGPTANGGADHNPGISGGKYLYTEASSCVIDTANLISDLIYTTGGEPNIFFEFWYHQYGAQIDVLFVEARQVVNGVPGNWNYLDTLFTPPPGLDLWQQGLYDLSTYVGDTFQIRLRGVTGTSFGSDLALDNFSIYSIALNDAGITAIDGPVSPVTPGVNNVDVSITNFGFSNLTAATIEWEYNGVLQTPFAYTGNLITNQFQSNVTIGTANVTPGLVTIKAWTSLPNGVIDSVPGNDTTMITGCSGALRGSYTVGGPSADFIDITTLSFVLSTCGIDSHTVINVNPGFYAERLILDHVPGTGINATLTIDGANSALATISNTSAAVVYLNGTDYTTIKNLTIEALGTIDNYGVQLRDTASWNTIDSCRIVMDATATNLSDVIGVSASDTETSSFTEGQNALWTTVSNCHIIGGEKGIHFEGQNALRTIGNRFLNNLMEDVEDYGFYMDDQDSMDIVGNRIVGLRNANADAIYCFDIQMFNISENEAVNVPDWGLYIADGNFSLDGTPTSRGRIINNMISSTTDYAAYFDDFELTDIIHNTFANTTTILASGAMRINDFTGLNIRNNIFYSDGTFAVYSDDDITATPNMMDYNAYYSTGTDLVDAGPTIYADLASWQIAWTENVSSIETDPVFVGGIADLHVLSPAVSDAGDNVGILVDIDGDLRPSGGGVDIGADEFIPVADDAASVVFFEPMLTGCGDSNTVVSVIIRNLGSNTITSMPISVNYSGDATGTLSTTYAGSLGFNQYDTVFIGTINTYMGGVYNIDGFISLSGDTNTSNDTFPSISLNYISYEPQGMNGVGCNADSAYIYAMSIPGVSYNWFQNSTDVSPIAMGDSLLVPSISTQNTYYLEYANNSDSLATPFNTNNGAGGNMWDVVALNTVNIQSLAMNFDPGTVSVDVWYRVGTWVGNDLNQNNDWILLGSANNFVTAGLNLPTQIPLTLNVTIPAGQTYAFYVQETSGGNLVNYTNGTAVGNILAQNADIQILEGCGKASTTNFNTSTFQPRVWNGIMYYGSTACSNLRIPVSASTIAGPTVSLGADTTLCANNYMLDAGTNAATYNWSTSEMTQMISTDSSGTYVVMVADSLGCMATDTVNLTLNPLPNVDLGADTTLCGTMYSFDAANAGATFNWSTADTTQMIMVMSTGTYSVMITDSLGCMATDSVNLTLNIPPTVNLGADTTICGSLTIDAANAGATFNWSTSETTQSINADSTAMYSVMVTDAAGCMGTDTISVTVLPDATGTDVQAACGSFQWIDGITYTASNNTAQFILSGAASNGCDSTVTLDLTLTVVDTSVTVAGTTLTANAAGLSYQWVDCNNGNAAIAGETNQSFTATVSGNYAVEITDGSCTSTSSCSNVVVVGLESIAGMDQVVLYPNPTKGEVTVDFGTVVDGFSMRLLALDGRQIQQFNAISGKLFTMSLENLPSGMYFLEVTSKDGQVSTLKVSKL